MHKFILDFFTQIKDMIQFCKLICSFLIIFTLLAWIENIIQAHWIWLDLIRPFLDGIYNFVDGIYSFSFSFLGTTFDMKYISTIVILLVILVISNFLLELTENTEDFYEDKHILYKKEKEKIFNSQLIKEIRLKEKKILKYAIYINTQISKKYSHKEINVNIDEQNKKMNSFISQKTQVTPMTYRGGFLYCFDNFNQIDNVLDVLFKVIQSDTPLDYAICVQAGDNLDQLRKLAELKIYDKIITCADTVLRYKFNTTHRYATKDIGIFQKENGTLEVHEFNEIS